MTNIVKQPCDEGVLRATPCQSPCPQQARPWVLTATILGSSMAFISSTLVNVALPTLQTQLDATASEAQWIVESYALLLGALVLIGGSLGDRYGRRRVFIAGVVLFSLTSAWCGLAPSIMQLIWARGAQGIGGALMIPGSLAIISATFPANVRGQAIGLWSGFTAITSAIGPVLGGWLIETLSWRWIFWLNLPIAIVVIAISLWQVPESRDEQTVGPLDCWGAFLAVLGLGNLVYGLLESPSLGSLWLLSVMTLGVLLLAAFLWVEAHAANPMMPLMLFHSRTFTGANLLTLLLYAALGGVLFFLPLNLIQVQGYSATAAGAALVPFPVIIFVLSRWSGNLVSQYGARTPLMLGPTITAIGFGLMALPQISRHYWTSFFPAIVTVGLGMAVCVAPLTTIVMESVETRYAGVASGINNAVSRVASLLAIAILGIVMLSTFSTRLDIRLEPLKLSLANQQFLAAQYINLGAAKIPSGLDENMRAAVEQAIAMAFVDGFRIIMSIACVLSVLGAVTAASLIDSTKKHHSRSDA